ncbi:DNA polymerase I [Deferribacterales bacterium RsTz2092]
MIAILDGNSIAYRAYHKAPSLTANGMPTGAVHLFFNIIGAMKTRLQPSEILAVFDAGGQTARHQAYPQYKATREAMPAELSSQLAVINELLPLAGVPVYAARGLEADDIIATLVAKRAQTDEIVIITKDKDLFQLVNERVKIYDDNTGALLGRSEAIAKYGVAPEGMLDYLSLMGDKSDNIHGVMGVGEKTAAKLISEYGSLEAVFANIDKQKGKLKENLLRDKDNAFFARTLVALQNIELPEPKLNKDTAQLTAMLDKLRLKTAAQVLSSIPSVEHSAEYMIEQIPAFDIEPTADMGALIMGSVKVPKLILAVGGEVFVADDTEYEEFEPEKHNISGITNCYDIKNLLKRGFSLFHNVRDYLLISWLCEPDTATLNKRKTESTGEFIARLLAKVGDYDERIKQLSLEGLYTDLELPIARLLANAECSGIRIAPQRVVDIANKLKKHLQVVASKITMRAGFDINLNSPKQLAEFLYDKLMLIPATKKNRSTAEDVLKELMVSNSAEREVLNDILDYREHSKLLSTYTQPLLDAMDADERIRTTFKQTGTATGRLSSANPNLQNIPVRSEAGATIRGAFIPAEGYTFVTLDYSQIELRVLAHMSGDTALCDAFKSGKDVHTITAMNIFGKREDEVTNDTRRLAKAVNFGILYGLSPYGLSRDTGISASEAKSFISAYFGLYKGVREFIDGITLQTRRNGYCETLLGRKRFFLDINSSNGMERARAERAAVNAPIQGSAADIIKLAMLRCDKMLAGSVFNARLLLQIHDELLFEVKNGQEADFITASKREMELAFPLNVPLEVNVGTGDNWGSLK